MTPEAANSEEPQPTPVAEPVSAKGRLERIGVALFSLPRLLDEDFEGALRLLADIGYCEVEFFGPYAFSAPESIEQWKDFAPALGLRGSGHYGRTPAQIRELLERYSLTSPSMHTDLPTLRTQLGPSADAAHVLGQRYVVLSAIPAAERASLDGYKRMADEFNEIGFRAERLGIRFAYHNHGYGLAELEGELPFQLLLERTDPRYVDLQLDLFWTVAGGGDPVAYLDAAPGRFRLLHIKDMAEDVRFSGDGSTTQQWLELFPQMADAGDGVLDLPRILSHAQKAGVQHFLVERDLVAKPAGALSRSYRYLSGVKLER